LPYQSVPAKKSRPRIESAQVDARVGREVLQPLVGHGAWRRAPVVVVAGDDQDLRVGIGAMQSEGERAMRARDGVGVAGDDQDLHAGRGRERREEGLAPVLVVIEVEVAEEVQAHAPA